MSHVSRRAFCSLSLVAAGAALSAEALASFEGFGRVRRQIRDGELDILVYGDAGDGSVPQIALGEAMWREYQKRQFAFAVSTGDNQYLPTSSNVYERIFERPYAKLIAAGVPFYQTLGNHDHEWNRVNDQLAYSRRVNALARGVGGFVMPSRNYVIRKPNVKWIVVDVANALGQVDISDETYTFLERELSENTPDWKILTTHYPLWSTGPRGDNRTLQGVLLPLLERHPVDMYFCGHEHNGEVVRPWNWMFTATVGGGREYRPGRARSENESLYFMDQIGFARVRLAGDVARFSFIDVDNKETYVSTIQKRTKLWADIETQDGDTVRARLRLPQGLLANDVEAEIGFAGKNPSDPILEGKGWKFEPLEYLGYDRGSRLEIYTLRVRPELVGQVAIVRFRPIGLREWTYADSGEGALHGNYDGVEPAHYFPVKAF